MQEISLHLPIPPVALLEEQQAAIEHQHYDHPQTPAASVLNDQKTAPPTASTLGPNPSVVLATLKAPKSHPASMQAIDSSKAAPQVLSTIVVAAHLGLIPGNLALAVLLDPKSVIAHPGPVLAEGTGRKRLATSQPRRRSRISSQEIVSATIAI